MTHTKEGIEKIPFNTNEKFTGSIETPYTGKDIYNTGKDIYTIISKAEEIRLNEKTGGRFNSEITSEEIDEEYKQYVRAHG